MKFTINRAFAFVAVSATILLTVSSCSKNNNSSSGAGMSATVGGSAWGNNYPVGAILYTSDSSFDIGAVQAKAGDTTAFDLNIFFPITLNTAMSSTNTNWYMDYVDHHTLAQYSGFTAGSHSLITVTSYNANGKTVAGTFSGVLYNSDGSADSVVVTNGKFNSGFQIQN